MHSLRRTDGSEIPTDEIAVVTQLYEAGLCLQAFERTRALPPLAEWRGTAARIIGGRLAGNVGNQRLARWLHGRAYLDDRRNIEAAYYHTSDILHWRGPYLAWRFFERLPDFPDASPALRGDLLALRARVACEFRDFERAEQWLAEAERLDANRAWLWCERSHCLEAQDRYEAALEATEQALTLRPWFRPAVQGKASLLQLLRRDEEAVVLLTEALTKIESGACAAQMATILDELGRHREALSAWEQMKALYPLAEESVDKWWHARMADGHYYSGEFAPAAEHARLVETKGFYERLATRLAAAQPEGRRVHLQVGFVRQHHLTCAPATLSAISRYWGVPVDHKALAATICYDGTPDHVERHWAETNGYVVREFKVTREAALALLDRGVPFTLTTTETTSGHLQAVIGYDTFRDTLLIRDPYQRLHQEFNIDPLLERYAAFGPRGMVLLPASEGSRLEGVELPEAELYDLRQRFLRALHGHERGAAEAALAALEARDPRHRITLFARRSLASYDSHPARELAAAEELLALYPKNGNLLWSKLRALRELTCREEHRKFLHGLVVEDVDPLFWREWATELSADAREFRVAQRLVLRGLRHRPQDAENLSTLASLLWDQRDFTRATELYRLAACVRDTLDGFSRSYFLAARHLRETEAALAMLRGRCARHGAKSSQPARLLFWALNLLDRDAEAWTTLEDALKARPDDGDLLLFAADACWRRGETGRAEALLGAAEKRVARSAWLRAAAAFADYRCDLARALALWREVLAGDPLAQDAQGTVVRLIAELEGREAALAHLRESCARFPHHLPLHRLWIGWIRDSGAEAAEPVIRAALALNDDDAWVCRELALNLSDQRRYDEALSMADAALQLEPAGTASHHVRGRVLLNVGRYPDARESMRTTLRLGIDTPGAIELLLETCETIEERRVELGFVRDELIRQVVFGDGLLAYREAAFPILEPPELLAALREALAARPDLWHAWSAVVRQLMDMQQLDEALTLARQMTGRFPLRPRVWFDLALVHQARRERDEEIPPLRRALQLSPAWSVASRQLGGVYERKGEFTEARKTYEQAIANAPLDVFNHGELADLLWRHGDREAALSRATQALRLDPGYDWAWRKLRDGSVELGRENLALDLARELTETRPGEPRSWYRLAEQLPKEDIDGRLAALDRAVNLHPRFTDAHDSRAHILANAGRFEEALAACAPAAFDGHPPYTLRGRAAWIEAARGDLAAATARMREVVAEVPDYYWGWSLLADWAEADARYAYMLEIAQRMARLAPRSAIPLGYIADAQLKLGDKKAAWDTLRKAFELDPTYQFAGFTIFNGHLQANDLSAASATLAQLEIHQPAPATQCAKVRLLARQRQRQPALDGLRGLTTVPVNANSALTDAVGACVNAGWSRDVERLLGEVLDQPNVNPEVGAKWVELFTKRKAWGCRKRIYKLDSYSALGRRARFCYLRGLAEQKNGHLLRKMLKCEGSVLREDPQLWGEAGYALATLALHKDNVAWLHDWEVRADAEPWMLSNLALSLRVLGRNEQATAVNRRALTLRSDQTSRTHRLWIAAESAANGETAAAEQHLAQVPLEGLSEYDAAVHRLASAVLDVEKAPVADRAVVFEGQRRSLLDPKLRKIYSYSSVKQLGRRSVETMARSAGRRPFRLATWGSSSPGSGGLNIRWPFFFLIIIASNAARMFLPGDPSSHRATDSTPPPMTRLITPRPFVPRPLGPEASPTPWATPRPVERQRLFTTPAPWAGSESWQLEPRRKQ